MPAVEASAASFHALATASYTASGSTFGTDIPVQRGLARPFFGRARARMIGFTLIARARALTARRLVTRYTTLTALCLYSLRYNDLYTVLVTQPVTPAASCKFSKCLSSNSNSAPQCDGTLQPRCPRHSGTMHPYAYALALVSSFCNAVFFTPNR